MIAICTLANNKMFLHKMCVLRFTWLDVNVGLRAYLIWVSLLQGDLKQYLKISKSKDEKVKVHPLSTKQKVTLGT